MRMRWTQDHKQSGMTHGWYKPWIFSTFWAESPPNPPALRDSRRDWERSPNMGNIWVFDAKKIVRSPTLAAGDHTKKNSRSLLSNFWKTLGDQWLFWSTKQTLLEVFWHIPSGFNHRIQGKSHHLLLLSSAIVLSTGTHPSKLPEYVYS